MSLIILTSVSTSTNQVNLVKRGHRGRISVGHVRVCNVKYLRLDRVNRHDRFSMKNPLRSSARGASFHTKHASNVNAIETY
jgi:hypothetical protein